MAAAARQRLVVADTDGSEVFRRARGDTAETLITYASHDTARASVDDPGVQTIVRGDGYYLVCEWPARPGPARVVARGHLDPGRWAPAQLHHIHAGQCPAPVSVAGGAADSHCGLRVDATGETAPYCDTHALMTGG
jgi:hypothetical protein